MGHINTLIKWPGGKSKEIKYIEHLIPQYDRYIEPFFGGGAMFFHLQPSKALINDISKELTDFYSLIKEQNELFKCYLNAYCILFNTLIASCERHYNDILEMYVRLKRASQKEIAPSDMLEVIRLIYDDIDASAISLIIPESQNYQCQLATTTLDKMKRTLKNESKSPFSASDLKGNLITGFSSGTYMYFRNIYNKYLTNRNEGTKECRSANFYFIREYCYGSMFRYNGNGEFNIPYGGMSYNKKNLRSKIDYIFSQEISRIFCGTDIYCMDFERFLTNVKPTENDFVFLDPPYDTDFSNYEGTDFTQSDQRRLAEILKEMKSKFILIIKNTEFIYSLYANRFNILCFDKTYTYNVRSRNERNVEHLIITNLPT